MSNVCGDVNTDECHGWRRRTKDRSYYLFDEIAATPGLDGLYVGPPGLAAGVLNHPADGIAWLANKLAPFNTQLEPGQNLLCGSFTRPIFASPGDVFHAD